MASKKKTTKAKVEPVDSLKGCVPIGLDASWTGCAVTALDDDGEVLSSEVISTKPGDFKCRSARLQAMGSDFISRLSLMDSPGGKIVAMEDYAMGSKTRPQMAGELAGHLRMLMWVADVPFILVPPTMVKKYATGKGVAAKEVMMREVYRRWGYEAKDNNGADAYTLARIAAEYAAGGWTKKFAEMAQKFDVTGLGR